MTRHLPDLSRRSLLQLAGASLLAGASSASFAQAWPKGTLRFISQSSPGDAVDLRLRDFVEHLGPHLNGVSRIVDNKPGAGGVIAAQSLLSAESDGQTVFLGNASMTILPSYHRNLPFSPQRDFTPVALSGQAPNALAILATRPEKTLGAWLESARKRQGGLNYGSAGTGSPGHLYGWQVSDEFGLKAEHVAYRGQVPTLVDLVAGRLDYIVMDIVSMRPFIEKGDLRVLAVAADERSKYLPDVPTFKELGYAGYDRLGWTIYFMKAGTPAATVTKLAQAINAVNGSPEWEKKRIRQWSDWQPLTPTQLEARVKRELEAWGGIIRRGNIHA